jgi:epoxyqueuosine reductase
MNNTIEKAIRELQKNGCKAQVIQISHLPDIREDIEKLLKQGLINKRMNASYLRFQYEPPTDVPSATTILVVAIPSPITRTNFTWHGKTYQANIPPQYIRRADEARVKEILTSSLKPAGCGMSRARLPLKTLAVRSGLAQYGRNNITYVPGFGSFFRLAAYYTDCPTERDNWQELKVMKACENCFKCLENCPTQCISTDRFLVHAENCLTWLNEITDDFPDWVRPEWHNAVIGCMRCQVVCPVDKSQIKKIVAGPEFSEQETELILQKIPIEDLPEPTRDKLLSISAEDWYDVFARNLRALIAG